ncbi:uncharacterized protein C1orf131 homolog [Hyposmocoma kahamanoa]|uniref:uncharacterized protein C1orf131 homolog n=1 Tax=Hyposmocoma kahamanoa TaxID=1477025 RepID=UPI000E6D9FB2|nr:uncharacterized protein C1orf131 homolog [Hyposmocoma kahamanoa]
MSLVLTKAALALKNAESNFQVVKFEAHKSKKKKVLEFDKNNYRPQETIYSKKDLDLKKIRHEVVKFGMSGFVGTKKEEAKIALAVSLGAKPPKKDYVNYKELMQKRKLEKLKEKAEKQQMISKSVLQSGAKRKKKGVNNDVGHFLSGYGKVQKKDLKKDNKTTKKKKK